MSAMASAPLVCRTCLRTLALNSSSKQCLASRRSFYRSYSQQSPAIRHSSLDRNPAKDAAPSPPAPSAPEPGAMSQRLEAATEEALLSGGRAGRRAIEDAGFSEDLKNRLLSKLADAQLHSSQLSAVDEDFGSSTNAIPRSAGAGTRDIAGAAPWTGEEAPADAVLRMLNDSHKPLRPELRGRARIPQPRGDAGPVVVDMRLRREPAVQSGRKVADARDRAAMYAGMGLKDRGLSEEERKAAREEMKSRFEPSARAMPNTLAGLAALANERIEDAIARGQFKDIPRGPGVERDTRSDNPFIDTTEYIMNKMIKRQEIVPPWIEKQQELSKAAGVFRARLRKDWKRHAARMISSRGGSLQEKMAVATEFARAEERYNPRRRTPDQVSIPSNSTDDVVMVKMRQQVAAKADTTNVATESQKTEESASPVNTIFTPFRDPAWEATERSYMEVAIRNLNAITRSYNLMAPELAKKPYFTLERELNNCFADVAPQLAGEIKDRASRPSKSLIDPVGHGPQSILDRFAREGKSAKIYDSRTPNYGLKEMWKDFWKA